MALIDCPACAHKVSDQAPSCPQCGHPIRPAETPAAPSPAPRLGHRREILNAVGLSLLAFGAVLVLLFSFQTGPGDAGTAATPGARQPSDLDAVEQCRRMIQDQLGPLRTAEYPSPDSASVERGGGGSTFTVRSYMDLVSTRGEPLRSTYTCVVRAVGPGDWEIVSLRLP